MTTRFQCKNQQRRLRKTSILKYKHQTSRTKRKQGNASPHTDVTWNGSTRMKRRWDWPISWGQEGPTVHQYTPTHSSFPAFSPTHARKSTNTQTKVRKQNTKKIHNHRENSHRETVINFKSYNPSYTFRKISKCRVWRIAIPFAWTSARMLTSARTHRRRSKSCNRHREVALERAQRG